VRGSPSDALPCPPIPTAVPVITTVGNGLGGGPPAALIIPPLRAGRWYGAAALAWDQGRTCSRIRHTMDTLHHRLL